MVLIRLKMNILTVEDLDTIVSIAGMNETHRTAFMKKMTMYNRAEGQFLFGEHNRGGDDEFTCPKKTLFTKVGN